MRSFRCRDFPLPAHGRSPHGSARRRQRDIPPMIGLCRVGILLGLALASASPGLCIPDAHVHVAAPASWVDSLEKPDFAAPSSGDAKQGFDILLSEAQISVEDQARYTH